MKSVIGAALYLSACALAVVIYRWLPESALAFGRLAVSGGLVLPLLCAGLLVGEPPSDRRLANATRLLLSTSVVALGMGREAIRMHGGEPPRFLEVVSLGILLLLLAGEVPSWWQRRSRRKSATT